VALTEEAAERRVLERELAIAHDMQMSMLPNRCRTYREVSVAATLKPARSVGGDLYDYWAGERSDCGSLSRTWPAMVWAPRCTWPVAKALFRASAHGDVSGCGSGRENESRDRA
jgi:serine phosphatase RsbU (regulator of sigma subunit)